MDLDQLHAEIKACSKCSLRQNCTQVVPGEGNPNAGVVFFAEAPGAKEDVEGRPLIGRSGTFFRIALARAGMKEKEVYLSNIVRCHPEENRDPLPDEIESCWPWTLKTLQLIRPKVLVPMGRPALVTLSQKLGFAKKVGQNSIMKLAGIPFYVEEKNFFVFPIFHPAFAIRRSSLKPEFRAHMLYLGKALPEWMRR